MKKVYAALCVLAVASVLAAPRDLTAEVAVGNYVAQGTNLRLRVEVFANEMSLTVTNKVLDIEDLLLSLGVDSDTRAEIHDLFTTSSANIDDGLAALSGYLGEGRAVLVAINRDLNLDLGGLQQDYDILRFHQMQVREQLDNSVNDVSAAMLALDEAITRAVEEKLGPDVTRVFVTWQRVLDVVLTQQVQLEDSRAAYQLREGQANLAIEAVLQQAIRDVIG